MTARHLLILVATAAALSACTAAEKDKAEDGAKPSALVTTAMVETNRLSDSLTAFGVVEFAPEGERTVAAEADATVEAVRVSAGSPVSQGTELLRLKPSPQAALDLAKAAADLDVASRALDRVKRLRAAGLASDGEVETARATQVTAQAMRASLLDRAARQRSLRSPSAGVVESLAVTPGDQVAAGSALVKLGAADSLRVRLGLEAADVQQVRPGGRVIVTSLTGEALGTGTIRTVEPRIDPQTRLASVIVQLAGKLTPGLSVRGEIALLNAKGANAQGATIPRGAVTYPDDGASVFVVEKGVAHRRAVKLGPETEGKVGVLDGLKPGERVVVDGVAVLEDGMAVRDAKAGNP